VFTNKDGSTGILYLVCSQLDASWDTITTVYQKRWNVEVFHKSLKSNAAFAKSPARAPKTQSNHLFASIVAVFKMEKLKMSTKLNHFALKSKLYVKAIRTAFDELQILRAA
ncbi:IS701 family transposase, partial [Leucothrix pacifica]